MISQEEMQRNYEKGIIVICPVCHKVDIIPRDHLCDPEAEERRQIDLEYYD